MRKLLRLAALVALLVLLAGPAAPARADDPTSTPGGCVQTSETDTLQSTDSADSGDGGFQSFLASTPVTVDTTICGTRQGEQHPAPRAGLGPGGDIMWVECDPNQSAHVEGWVEYGNGQSRWVGEIYYNTRWHGVATPVRLRSCGNWFCDLYMGVGRQYNVRWDYYIIAWTTWVMLQTGGCLG